MPRQRVTEAMGPLEAPPPMLRIGCGKRELRKNSGGKQKLYPGPKRSSDCWEEARHAMGWAGQDGATGDLEKNSSAKAE